MTSATNAVNNKNHIDNEGRKEKIPLTVFMIGLMMFLVNFSYIMVYSFAGVYLKNILGVTMVGIGFLEGVAEFSSYMMKLASGIISDQLHRRKPIIIVGYIMLVTSRIFLALSPTFMIVFTARMIERLGNGIQSTPRDALVGDIAPSKRRGEAYGIKRTLSQAGAFCGGIAGIAAMYFTDDNYQQVFQLACIPSLAAFSILIFFVKENKANNTTSSAVTSSIPLPKPKRRHPITFAKLKRMGRSYWLLMIIAAVFYMARIGETFLTMHANTTFSMKATYISSIMIAFNLGYCMISYPSGYISDRMNRHWMLAIGIILMIMADFFLATSDSLYGFFIGVVFWGFQYGITQNVFMTLVAENVPEDLRGTGFGVFYLICALSALLADAVGGKIAHEFGCAKAYMASGVMAFVALLTLIMVMGYRGKKKVA